MPRRRKKPGSTKALLAVLFLGGLCMAIVTCRHGLPDDTAMMAAWDADKVKLTALAEFLVGDETIQEVKYGVVTDRNLKPVKDTADRLLKLLPYQCVRAYRLGYNEREVRFAYALTGTTLGGREKGIAYIIGKPEQLYNSLDFFLEPKEEGEFYRHIEGPWYVYMEHDK